MDRWPHGSMGDPSYLGILPGSQEFGVFLGEGKSAVIRLRSPGETGIPETGSGYGQG